MIDSVDSGFPESSLSPEPIKVITINDEEDDSLVHLPPVMPMVGGRRDQGLWGWLGGLTSEAATTFTTATAVSPIIGVLACIPK